MRSLVFVGVCLPLISGSPVDIPRSDLSPRLVTSIEQASCGVVGYKPDPILTRSLKCSLVDCQELCSATAGCQSYAQSSARCLLFSSPVAEGFQQDSTSPFTYYDIDCSTPMTSSTETLPEATDSVTTELSTSGTEVTATSNPLPSSTTATFITEISTELASASISASSGTISATTTDLTTDPESAGTSVSSDITSTTITLRSNTETTTTGDATTIAAGESTTATSSTPTVYIIRLVNPDESTFGYVSTAPGTIVYLAPKRKHWRFGYLHLSQVPLLSWISSMLRPSVASHAYVPFRIPITQMSTWGQTRLSTTTFLHVLLVLPVAHQPIFTALGLTGLNFIDIRWQLNQLFGSLTLTL
ncbi:hypothetical protein FOYG_13534 [Fusarium oxysporum NRRL 32931]|uniref:Apple domain-containing protein n=1 Tax=Fusarium oxysporum NRRL 32931 TaxID=660029 RepID=W9HU54_FUSOX|nr:hypothetical protein FOYG_13534 [Fusarium oxysporum NRRL 32931]